MSNLLIEVENLSKTGNDSEKILEKINLKIYKKRTLGLIGPTGSGKTSLLRLINMIDNPSSGNINYKGKNKKKKKNPLELKRKITMVFQKPIVFKGTVFDNVYYGLNIRGEEKEE
jgi:tungstate transport system ATP-binding protein